MVVVVVVSCVWNMATGGDDLTIVDQDEDHHQEGIAGGQQLKVEEEAEDCWDADEDKDHQQLGVGRRRKESKRNNASAVVVPGILRIDTTAASSVGYANSRRKSSASSVGDFRSGASYLNPQVSQFPFSFFFFFLYCRLMV